jgi:hypothetical protein
MTLQATKDRIAKMNAISERLQPYELKTQAEVNAILQGKQPAEIEQIKADLAELSMINCGVRTYDAAEMIERWIYQQEYPGFALIILPGKYVSNTIQSIRERRELDQDYAGNINCPDCSFSIHDHNPLCPRS